MKKPESFDEITEKWFTELKEANIKELPWLELKSESTEGLGESMTAFLNQQGGGLILYGMHDDLLVKEINSERDLHKISERKGRITDPPRGEINVKEIKIEGKSIIAILMKEGKHYPYFYNGKIYFRGLNTNYPITDKRTIKHLLSQEINEAKALQMLKKYMISLKEETNVNMGVIDRLRRLHEKHTSEIPFPLDEKSLDYFLSLLRDHITEKGLLDTYIEIIKRVKQINILISTSYSRLDSGYLNIHLSRFGTLFKDTIEKIDGLIKNLEG